MKGDKYYRIYYTNEGEGLTAEVWYVRSETEKTVLLEKFQDSFETHRVNKHPDGKRYAYARMEDALASYLVRKKRQRQRLQNTLNEVTASLNALETRGEKMLLALKEHDHYWPEDEFNGSF